MRSRPDASRSDAAIVFERVSKVFTVKGRRVAALTELSLELPWGRSAALVGPNGAGKTTALRIAATLVLPSSGRVTVAGMDAALDASGARSHVGVSLGSGRSFYWRLSAGHNLSFAGRLRGVRHRELGREISRVAAEFDLERFLGTPARNLSRGSLARLAIARACLGDPPCLVLDEPFASIDERGRELVWEGILRRLRRGGAVLVATHDAALASLCDSEVQLRGAPPGGRFAPRSSSCGR